MQSANLQLSLLCLSLCSTSSEGSASSLHSFGIRQLEGLQQKSLKDRLAESEFKGIVTEEGSQPGPQEQACMGLLKCRHP